MPVSIFSIYCGFNQGCNLSPTLFTFSCKRLSFRYKEFEYGNITAGNLLFFLPYYADDIVFVASTTGELPIATECFASVVMCRNQRKVFQHSCQQYHSVLSSILDKYASMSTQILARKRN